MKKFQQVMLSKKDINSSLNPNPNPLLLSKNPTPTGEKKLKEKNEDVGGMDLI